MLITQEVIVFLQSCILGVLLAMFYDVFRIIRIAFKNSKILIFIEDVVYFVIITLVSFIFIVVQNDGRLRGFLLIGEVLGAVLYFFTLSIAIIKIAHLIIDAVKSFLKFLYRLFIKPIIKLFCFIFSKIKSIFHFINGKIKIIMPKRKIHLK